MSANRKNSFKFNVDLEKFSKKMQVDFATTVRSIALELLTGIVKRTPVRTGLARSGWVVGVAKEAPTPGEYITSEQAVIQNGVRALESLKKLPTTAYIPSVFISNYVPYIIYLESGSTMSAQAPNGMVAVTIASVASKLKSKIR